LKKSDQRKIKERGSMRTVKTVLAEADGPLVQTLMDFVITPAAGACWCTPLGRSSCHCIASVTQG
jgi:hypothetical protein